MYISFCVTLLTGDSPAYIFANSGRCCWIYWKLSMIIKKNKSPVQIWWMVFAIVWLSRMCSHDFVREISCSWAQFRSAYSGSTTLAHCGTVLCAGKHGDARLKELDRIPYQDFLRPFGLTVQWWWYNGEKDMLKIKFDGDDPILNF